MAMAGSTVRGGEKEGLVTGKAVNTDVEEAGYGYAEQGENNDKNSFHYALYFVCFCR